MFCELLWTYVLFTGLIASLCLHSTPVISVVWISATLETTLMNPCKSLAWTWTATAGIISSHIPLYTPWGAEQIVGTSFPV